ncbi:MAG: nucleoside-triphosphatase [Bacteroidales bacterium]|nr:nucleoside-triphosphatase [Bacteroidales bacterium]
MIDKGNDIWLKAATAGSLWASVEIVVGSFLHNLRIPFAGTILAVMGLSLMIAFQFKWNDKGLIWRAGLICAIMKSLSPSAIIIGPMVGILTEAILLDLFIRIFGRNAVGFLLGSIAAVLSALFHKVFTIILLYGFNIVKILENMYRFAEKQLKVIGPEPEMLLLYLVLLYFLFGIVAATIGILAGKKINKQVEGSIQNIDSPRPTYFSVQGGEKFSLFLLAIHIIALVGGLYLVNRAPLYISLFALIPYIIFVIYKYKRALRRFAKPIFWIQLVLILLVSVLFWNEFNTGSFLLSDGFIIGIKMIIRAILVVMVFSAISVELRNPVVKTVMYRRGFSRLYTSLGLAFSVLPGVISQITRPGNILLRPVNSLSETIMYSEGIFQKFKEQMKKRQLIYIIAGNQREGKTTFLKQVIEDLKNSMVKMEGFIADGIDQDGKRMGFKLINVSNGKGKVLCNINGKPEWEKTGKYYFNPDGLEFGRSILNKLSADTVVVIDEIGPLEMEGGGWADSIQKILEKYDNTMIWVVRRNLTEKIIQTFDLKNVSILDISKYSPEELVNSILNEKKGD